MISENLTLQAALDLAEFRRLSQKLNPKEALISEVLDKFSRLNANWKAGLIVMAESLASECKEVSA